MNVVMNQPLQPPVLPDERVFDNGVIGNQYPDEPTPTSDPDQYEYLVRALIDDAFSFEESTLAPAREENLRYYYGQEPPVENVDEDGTPTTSTAISTDVRDTVMAMMPSLIRIFTGPEHIVFCSPNYKGQEDLAKQQTKYMEYIFWEDNPGFLFLHDMLKDMLTTKICVANWYSDTSTEVVTQEYQNISQQQLQVLVYENETAELLEQVPSKTQQGLYDSVTLRWHTNKPIVKIQGIPLDEFRVSRNAKTVEDANVIGFDTMKLKWDLIADGYDEATIDQYTGGTPNYSADRIFRNTGMDETDPLQNYEIRYGEYFIRIDKDGDGIAELRKICTIGDNHYIVSDYPVQWANFAVGCADPRPHTLVGDCPSDLVKDIQRVKTNMLRGSLDSLAQSIWPRTVFNELLVSADDVLNEEIGAAIRTKGSPADTVMSIAHTFVGQPVFQMFEAMEGLRQQKTGISDASKGLDPKALQSTVGTGVDAIISGAQERIELVARLFAETFLKPLFKGILREITSQPNPRRTVQMSGNWTEVDPSTYDPTMKISVNPTLGRGSDISRLMALQDVKQTQLMVVEKFGIANPIVGPEELMNTVSDMLAIANVKNVERYFKKITPEIMAGIMNQPKEPDPSLILAQAEMEKNKTKMITGMADQTYQMRKLLMDDDFRRDQLQITSVLEAAKVYGQFAIDVNEQKLEEDAQNAEFRAGAEESLNAPSGPPSTPPTPPPPTAPQPGMDNAPPQ